MSVKAHLGALPAQVSLALATCERAAEALAARQYEDPSVGEGILALRSLAGQVEEGVLAEVDVPAEVAESRRFVKGFLLPTDNPPELAARGQAVMDRLEEAVPASLHARVVVLDGPSLMAFARGGENLYIGQDVLDLPEGETAAILAHERAHLLERHLVKSSLCAEVASALATSATVPPTAAAALKSLGTLAQAAVQREQEFQADALGMRMLEGAGYPRQGMEKVLLRLAGDASPKAASPADDHPPVAERLAALRPAAPPPPAP